MSSIISPLRLNIKKTLAALYICVTLTDFERMRLEQTSFFIVFSTDTTAEQLQLTLFAKQTQYLRLLK